MDIPNGHVRGDNIRLTLFSGVERQTVRTRKAVFNKSFFPHANGPQVGNIIGINDPVWTSGGISDSRFRIYVLKNRVKSAGNLEFEIVFV